MRTKSVAIIGTGQAALAAGGVLDRHAIRGLNIDFFEARSEPGGRVSSRAISADLLDSFSKSPNTLKQDLIVEDGPGFVDRSNIRLRNLIERHGFTLEPVYGRKHESLPLSLKLEGQEYSFEEVCELAENILAPLESDRDRISKFPDGVRARELKKISILNYFQQLGADPLFIKAYDLIWLDDNGASISLSPAFSFFETTKGKEWNGNIFERKGYAKYRVKGGLSGFVESWVNDIQADFKYDQAVERIVPGLQGVRLEFAKGSRRRSGMYDTVIVTAPPRAMADIDISKVSFPRKLRKLIAEAPMAQHEKVHILSSITPSGSEGLFLNEDLGFSTWTSKNSKAAVNEPVVITAFPRGTPLNVEKLKKQIKQNYPDLKDARLKLAGKTKWSEDPYAGGSYSTFGLTTELREAAEYYRRRPATNKDGNVVMAGELFSPLPNFQGQMEGAIISGREEARNILQKERNYSKDGRRNMRR